MFKLFKSEVEQALRAHPPAYRGIFIEADIAALPEPVQRYFRRCGWIGRLKMTNATLAIREMRLKMSLDGGYVKVRSFQFNSVPEPVRLAYMESRMFGFLPFAGRDKYQNGRGNMYIKALNLIPVADLKGAEMDRAALATVLAETFLVPSYALQPYMKWQPIDLNTARATLTHNGNAVSGIFLFNDAGEFRRFETSDRYRTQKDGSMLQTRWIAEMGNYREINGLRIATEMSASWETETGFIPYAKMKIEDIRYDIETADEVNF